MIDDFLNYFEVTVHVVNETIAASVTSMKSQLARRAYRKK